MDSVLMVKVSVDNACMAGKNAAMMVITETTRQQ